MKTLRIQFSTWEAFDRAIQEVKNNYGDKMIYGEIYVPVHMRFKTWSQFNKVVGVVNGYRPKEKQNCNDACPGVCGEIIVELTWGMIR